MNEQNPELLKIMHTPPKGLIISGCIWFCVCISIITGMYFITYREYVYIPVVYCGSEHNKHAEDLFFTLSDSVIEMPLLHKGSSVEIEFNERLYIKGIINDTISIGKNKAIMLNSFNSNTKRIRMGAKGKAKIAISKKPMFELLPFLGKTKNNYNIKLNFN